MSKLHSETVASYEIKGKRVDVDLCWKGKDPKEDKDRFYEMYDEHGICLNLGEPWHDDDRGVPTHGDVSAMIEAMEAS